MNGEELERKKTICARLHDDFWVSFQNRTDFVATIKEDMDFYNGDQWPDNNIGNNIRITDNVIADIIRKLSSKINGTPVSFSYTATDGKTDCSALQRYDKYVLSSIGHRAFSLQSAINGENTGTEITYVRFDPDAPWNSGSIMDGGLEEEHISPLNFAVANPHCPSIQRQEWIMIWEDVYVGQLRAILKDEKFSDAEYKKRLETLYWEAKRSIPQPDDQNPDKDILNNVLLRCYIRFFRIKGEVCYTMETEYTPLYRFPRPMSIACSDAIAKKVQEEFDKKADKDRNGDYVDELSDERQFRLVEDLEIDFEDTIASVSSKPVGPSEHSKYRERFSLYPFALFVPKQIPGFLFGRSITKEMIRMQKGLNYLLSLNVKAVENTAWNKVFVRDGAMKPGETFSADPEKNIQHDHSKGGLNGFYTLAAPSAPAESFNMPFTLKQEMKDTNGATDFANGQMANQETSGYAVELMLKQANAPLEQEQELFWQYQTELARIRLMFYKHYIDKRAYTFEYSESEYQTEETARKTIIEGIKNGLPVRDENGNPIPPSALVQRFGRPTSRTQTRIFRREDVWGKDFDVQIDAQRGLVESELSTQQFYTNMFSNGQIAAYQQDPDLLEFIIETAPDSVLPREMRASMRHFVSKYRNSYIKQLEQANSQKDQIIESMSAYGQEQQKQFQNHINVADKMVMNAQRERDELARMVDERDEKASEGEIKSHNAKSIA